MTVSSSEHIQIGEYTIVKDPAGQVWITRDGGEGGVFNELELEAAIDAFFTENF